MTPSPSAPPSTEKFRKPENICQSVTWRLSLSPQKWLR